MRLYLGNKMIGRAEFNFDWFDDMAARLRKLDEVDEVFSPAERDRSIGLSVAGAVGTYEELEQRRFNRREALAADMAWIAAHSDGMTAGPDWADSPGTRAEVAFHQGLYLPVWRAQDFLIWGTAAPVLPALVPGKGVQ